MSNRKGTKEEQFNPLKSSEKPDLTPITSHTDSPPTDHLAAGGTPSDLAGTSFNPLAKQDNFLNLSDEQFDRFVNVLNLYAMFRNQATDFDAMIGFISTRIGDLSEQEKDLLLKIEYAYITSFKPNASLNVMMKLSNLLESVEKLKADLESFGLTRDAKQTGNYIKAVDSMTRMLKMASEMQEKLFSYAVVEGLIEIILNHDDEEIKVKVLDYLNKIRYGK